MSLEEKRIRHSYSFDCGTNKPNGYLLNPEGSKMIFFKELKNTIKLIQNSYSFFLYKLPLRTSGI